MLMHSSKISLFYFHKYVVSIELSETKTDFSVNKDSQGECMEG